MIKRILTPMLVVALAMSPAHNASAGGGGGFAGATEVTQIMNNAELALQSAEQQMQSIELVEQTYLQRLQQLSSTIGEYTAPFQRTYDTYQKIKATQDKLTSMKGNIEDLQGSLQQRFTQFSASNLSWQDWMAREGKMIQDGNERAKAQVESNQRVLMQTKDSMDAYQAAAQAMDGSQGTHQATRLLGAQLTLLGGDINKLITITAEANRNQGIAVQNQAIEQQRKAAQAEAVRRGFEDSRKETRDFYNALIKRGSSSSTGAK